MLHSDYVPVASKTATVESVRSLPYRADFQLHQTSDLTMDQLFFLPCGLYFDAVLLLIPLTLDSNMMVPMYCMEDRKLSEALARPCESWF